MTLLLYATVWASLAAFAAGEAARTRPDAGRLAFRLHTAGIVLMAMHMTITMGWVHGWSLAAAEAATAAQSQAVYGIDAAAGIYVNYLFLIVWASDAWWWRANPGRSRLGRTGLLILRAFYLIVIVNAAVIFAAGWRRALGVAVVVAAMAAWRRVTLTQGRDDAKNAKSSLP